MPRTFAHTQFAHDGSISARQLFQGYYGGAVLCGTLFFGGIQLSLTGTAYVLDVIIPLFVLGLLAFSQKTRAALWKWGGVIFLGALMILVFTLFDFYNHIDKEWIVRGLGRNIGCYTTFVFGLCVLNRWGAGFFFLLSTAILLSIPLNLFFHNSPELSSIVHLFKFQNGVYLIFPVLALVRRSRFASAILFAAFSIFLYVICDYRSAAAMCVCISVWLLNLKWIGRIGPRWTLILLIFAMPLGAHYALVYERYLAAPDEQRSSRMEASDSVRTEMALDALEKISERPLTGYGSWQHAIQFSYGIATGDNALQGVHSVPLQLGYEYGVLGLAFASAIALVLFWVLARFSSWALTQRALPGHLIPLCMFQVFTTLGNYLFGAIMGTGRFTVGLQFAFLAWIYSLMVVRKNGVPVRTRVIKPIKLHG